jgi:heat shock protein HslJ
MSSNIFTISGLPVRVGLLLLVVLANCTTPIAGKPVPPSSVVYFKGNGTQPVWNLEIAEDQVLFTSANVGFDRFILPHAEPIRSENGNIKTYTLHSKEADMEIQIAEMLCENPNSRERFPFSVSINVRRKGDKTPTVFSGCGLYVPDNRLRGKWMIESVRSTPLPDSLFKDQHPYVELAVDGSYFTAFAGCNMISGRLYFERALLRFTDFVVPKDKCDQITIEKSIIGALQFATQFSIDRDELMLGNPAETTLKLRKAK